jgi:hypothetical protein
MNSIKVGFLVSYDYEFLKVSLPNVYDHVEEIILAVDIDGKTWSGHDLTITDDFWKWVKETDTAHKIKIYKDHFYIPGLSPMECDTRERNMLGKEMGNCDWYVQIDSDEYFVDFEAFIKKLRHFKADGPTTIHCSVATLFKQLSSGYLVVGESFEALSFATNHPVYDLARNNTSGNKSVEWNDLVLHQSWARTEEEILQKLDNWSHKHDFNTESLFKLWNAVDEFNYYCLKDFHPLVPVMWPRLILINGTIEEILYALKPFKGNTMIDLIRKKKRKNVFSRVWKEIRA